MFSPFQLISSRADEEALLGNIDDESKKRREVLARRPSYRKILNELSSADISALTHHSSATSSDVKSESSASDVDTQEPTTISVGGQYLKVCTHNEHVITTKCTCLLTFAYLPTLLRAGVAQHSNSAGARSAGRWPAIAEHPNADNVKRRWHGRHRCSSTICHPRGRRKLLCPW